MIELEVREGDSHEFLHLASRLIAGAAIASNLPPKDGLRVIQIDGFFGRKWLGFRRLRFRARCLRVHNRSLKSDLGLPPFYFDRILSSLDFARNESGLFVRAYPASSEPICVVPGHVGGCETLSRGVHAWYSGGSGISAKGAVMVYAVKDGPSAAWYTSWDNRPPWKLLQSVGISARTCRHFINLGTQPKTV
jgi:hypothetical protein